MPRLGTVEGTVFYRNDRRHACLARYYVKTPKTGELAEAVVALAAPSLGSAGGVHQRALVTVDQKEMRFMPETIAIRVGDRVRFTNSDLQTHNISLNDPRLQFSDTIGDRSEAGKESFARASGIRRPFALGIKFHSQMQGWIYVFRPSLFPDHARSMAASDGSTCRRGKLARRRSRPRSLHASRVHPRQTE